MIKRVVEVGSPAKLSLRLGQLIVTPEDGNEGSVPLEDLGVLVLDDPRIVPTTALLVECARNNVAVIMCDARHLPCALTLPLEGHTLMQKHLMQQLSASQPTRKRVWQAVVQAKVLAQARVLEMTTGGDTRLRGLASAVRSGDPDNIEARAARAYWPALFGPAFIRDTDADGINALLNYGYAIIRAAVARAIVGAGMNPALGVFHRGRENAFTLADDLMEPLRPAVDLVVIRLEREGKALTVDRPAKRALLGLLAESVCIRELHYPLLVGLAHYVSSVRQYLAGETEVLEIPVFRE
jgi:CRISPR-associated protein Cas1